MPKKAPSRYPLSPWKSKLLSMFLARNLRVPGRSEATRLDLGLRFFLMAKTGALVDARRVNDEYRQWIATQPARYASVREELADFSRHGECYRKYEEVVATTLPSTDLKRILIDFDVSTALPLVLYLELDAGLTPDELANCLALVESFLARRILTGDETKEYNKLFVEVIGSINSVKGSAVLPALAKKLLPGGGTTRRWPGDAQIIEAALSRKLFKELRTPALRLILERIEVALRTKKSEDKSLPSGLQIEHVLPQKWWTHWTLRGKQIPPLVAEYPAAAKDDLLEIADEIRNRNYKLHTLGNLTLLNQYLNPAASNGSFDQKIVEYKNSVLRMNRSFDGLKAWDEASITARGQYLGELLCAIWARPKES